MTGALAVLAAAAVPAATVFAAPASAAQTQRVLLTATMHSCDYQPVEYAKFAGMPTPVMAEITFDGRTAVARVDMEVGGTANAQYIVRLIPAPHGSFGCHAGDPSIGTATLNTNSGGAGSAIVQTAVTPGTTGVWVSVELPQPNSQAPREFYSSTSIAAV